MNKNKLYMFFILQYSLHRVNLIQVSSSVSAVKNTLLTFLKCNIGGLRKIEKICTWTTG